MKREKTWRMKRSMMKRRKRRMMIVQGRSQDMGASSWMKPVSSRTLFHYYVNVDSDQLCSSHLFIYFPDVDDEYEDEEDQWEEGAEDILEKGEAEPDSPRCCVFVMALVYITQLASLYWRCYMRQMGLSWFTLQANVFICAGRQQHEHICAHLFWKKEGLSRMLITAQCFWHVDCWKLQTVWILHVFFLTSLFLAVSLRHVCPLQLTVILLTLSCCHHVSGAAQRRRPTCVVKCLKSQTVSQLHPGHTHTHPDALQASAISFISWKIEVLQFAV